MGERPTWRGFARLRRRVGRLEVAELARVPVASALTPGPSPRAGEGSPLSGRRSPVDGAMVRVPASELVALLDAVDGAWLLLEGEVNQKAVTAAVVRARRLLFEAVGVLTSRLDGPCEPVDGVGLIERLGEGLWTFWGWLATAALVGFVAGWVFWWCVR